ncbi:hypothetical protein M9H77_22951 [Catharanthus roseus]|uniref:Uncharacterized protein n=1 Tax=Catharanthus roseus TaxID=4058 RepID=A0ACC0ARN4_CATRO|nr:hypothetical protein M9H77_22951 [Catharanthus roseus]
MKISKAQILGRPHRHLQGFWRASVVATQAKTSQQSVVWSNESFAELFSSKSTAPSPPIIKTVNLYKGEPALYFDPHEILNLVAPFKLTLVGKFSHGRPSMDVLRKEFPKVSFKGSFSMGWMDSRHMLIHFDFGRRLYEVLDEGDMVFSRVSSSEPSILLAWVSLEGLPIHFFNKAALFSIATAIGNPLKIAEATTNLTRPSVPRVCIEVDLLKQLQQRIWIGVGAIYGFWQDVCYENLPPYCAHCLKMGHSYSNGCQIIGPKDPNGKKPAGTSFVADKGIKPLDKSVSYASCSSRNICNFSQATMGSCFQDCSN